jgi:glycosyltransferase involved in cell wall biosynthesis
MIKYSVIIPTYNNAGLLPDCLNSLLRQSIKPEKMEIIVVNDGSNDLTEKLVLNYRNENPGRNIVYIPKKNGGPASARNAGLKHSRGQIIFFTDDDCQPPALWMEKMLEIYKKNPGIAGVGGWYNPPVWQIRINAFHQFFYLLYRLIFSWGLDYNCGKTGEIFPNPAVNTGNISFYRWIFNRVGPFEETFIAAGSDDVEFCKRVEFYGFKIYYMQMHIIHNKSMIAKTFFKHCLSRSRGVKNYCHLKKLDPINFYSKARQRYRLFKIVYEEARYRLPDIRLKKSVLLIALVWFYFQNFLLKWPFFERPRRT